MKAPFSALVLLSVSLGLAACSGRQADHVKTPEEQLDEQLAMGEQQQKEEEQYSDRYKEASTDSEEAAKWDDRGAEIELKRAARSAETCPGSLPPEQQKEVKKGEATVTLTFQNDGHVKDAKINPEYADTPVGTCVLRAMGAVIVQAYSGPEKTLDWKVDLTKEQPAPATDKSAEKKKPAK